MNLWIRSQDKERLIKPIDFYIKETIDYVNKSSKFDIYALNLANDDIRIGTYKTKERALEVLDEIHGCIIDKEVLDGCNNILTLANKNNLNEVKQIIARTEKVAVYEMPKE